MIFISKNKLDEIALQMVKEGKKTVTRRNGLRLGADRYQVGALVVEPGKVFAVQPGRCKKAVCHVRVVSVMSHSDWFQQLATRCIDAGNSAFQHLDMEAKLEGFTDWLELVEWFEKRNTHIQYLQSNNLVRIQFELVDKKEN